MLISDSEQRKLPVIKEILYVMLKGSIHQEDIMILNVYGSRNSFKIHEAKTYDAERRNT